MSTEDPTLPPRSVAGAEGRGDPTADTALRLDDLVDRDGLTELCRSFLALFGIPVRVLGADGQLVANATKEHEVCAYVNTLGEGRRQCAATVTAVKADDGGARGDTLHPCFTGNAYRILPIDYDGRRIGRVIVGPYLPQATQELPSSLATVDPGIEPERARSLLARVPRATDATINRMALHLKKALDLILFSGHKALLTSQMHLMSVKESYASLEDKNRRLQEAYDRLRELDRLKSNFLATVSHELRTPLTSIIGYSEMLVEGMAGPLAPDQREFVQTIQAKGGELLALITSLLDLSKLESGTMVVRSGSVDIQEVLQQAASTLVPHARRKELELVVVKSPTLPRVKGDAERLRQVFANLIENAIKFTPPGGRVEVTSRSLGIDPEDADGDGDGEAMGFALLAPVQQVIEVRVADTGIGIPPKERERVFDPFYQVDSSSTREYGGTGLGLSIVRRLVDAHGGKIHIEENVPTGTVFVVRLPTSGARAETAAPS